MPVAPILFLFLLAALYLASFTIARTWTLNRTGTRMLRAVIVLSVAGLTAALVAARYNIYPRGYWVTKGLFWTALLSCMGADAFFDRRTRPAFEHLAYRIVYLIPPFFLVFLLVPFLGVGYGLIVYTRLIGSEKFILYSDEAIRIEQPSIRFLGPDPQPKIFVKQGLVSRVDAVLPVAFNDMKDTLLVQRRADSTYIITLRSPNNWEVPAGSALMEYRVGSGREDTLAAAATGPGSVKQD